MSLDRLIGLFKEMPVKKKMVIFGAGLLCFILLIAWAGGLIGGSNMAPLFSDLLPQDAADIITVLEADNIPYDLGAGGTTILVPEHQVHRTRLAVASQGLPSGGVVGFELLDQTRLGSTEFERRMSYLRALQGELSRTITQIDSVESARVHIVIPEPSLFVAERKQPTAGVLLNLRPGATLDPDRVRGVAHLVSRSVEGLSPDNVTVLDAYGRILSFADSDRSSSATTLSQLDTKATFEFELEKRLESLLNQVFGPGNALAQVNATLNFDERIIETNMFIPDENNEGLVRSFREVEEHFSGEGMVPGGVPGTAGNVAETPVYQEVGNAGTSEYERREVIEERQYSQMLEHQVIAPGAVQRLTVSVVINQQLNAAEQDMVTEMVAAAIGYDDQRRDNITITGVEFDTTLVDEFRTAMAADEHARQAEQNRMWIMIGAAVAVALLAAFIIRRSIVAGRNVVPEQSDSPEKKRRREPEVEMNEDAVYAQKEIERLVRQKPETVAHLIRAWIAEE